MGIVCCEAVKLRVTVALGLVPEVSEAAVNSGIGIHEANVRLNRYHCICKGTVARCDSVVRSRR